MSKCMTIADETIDQKDICLEIGPKEIVEIILEEALFSALIVSDKGCSQIGDSNITEEFYQQYDQLSNQKDFEQVEHSQSQPAGNKDSNFNFRENFDRAALQARENLEQIIDSFVKEEEKSKPLSDCRVISEEVLADNELQIKNGQIHLGSNKTDKFFLDYSRPEYFDKKDIIKDEKIEIEYFNEGQLNKIYVPLNLTDGEKTEQDYKSEERENALIHEKKEVEDRNEEKGKKEKEEKENAMIEEKAEKEIAVKEEKSQEDIAVKEVKTQEKIAVKEEKAQEDIAVEEEKAEEKIEEKEERVDEKIAVKEEKAQEEIAVKEEKAQEEIAVKEKKTEEKIAVKEERAEEKIEVKEEKVKEKIAVKEEKAQEEFAVKEEKAQEDTERPFKPFTTEDLRQTTLQIWENDNSSLVGRWDGDMLAQRDKVVKIIKELSSVHVFSDSFTDPNRPRACAFGEEDVKKMTKEIQDMNFTVSHGNSEASVSYYLDGQGDVDLEPDKKEKLQHVHIKASAEKNQNQFQEVTQNQIIQNSPIYITDIDPKNDDILNNNKNIEMKISTEMKAFPLNTSQSNLTEFTDRKNSDLFRKDSGSIKEENFTKSTNFIPKKTESLNETVQDVPLKDVDMTPDLEAKLFQTVQDVPDIRVSLPPLTGPPQQGTLSWNGLQWESKEAICTLNSNEFLEESHWERITVNYNPQTEEPEGKSESKVAEHFLQESQSQLDRCKSSFGVIQNGEDANLNAEKTNERLEETLIYAEKNVENIEKLEGKFSEEETSFTPEKTGSQNFINNNIYNFSQTSLNPQDSQINANSKEDFGSMKSNQDLSVTSQSSRNSIDDDSSQENELPESSDSLVSGSQKFKLHSPKMYMTPYHEPASQMPNDFNLTESEEAFIDVSENVIQIIDPQENSADEDSTEISFSLLSETLNLKSVSSENPKIDTKSESFLIERDLSFSDNETPPKKVYSGMTTIGPMKNIDHDPKDLTAPEIDYGKMTRITSSRQLARDMGLLNSDNPALSVKIIEEDDSDDDTSINFEDDHADRNSLVNRDIASLTKVQRIREVMSHQAKPDEDFEDEDSLPRPRLDLKDVESMTDERYKFPDVSMPLLSFEIGDRNIDAEKELIESMGLIISGLTNACFFEEETENNAETQTNASAFETENNEVESPEKLDVEAQNSKSGSISAEEVITTNIEEKTTTESVEEVCEKEVLNRKDSLPENSEYHKYSTLGNVFRKASGKFLRKDSELCMRTTKSLPRDTKKISTTNSIRSILDECQSSASSMLKKSCSLLRNTENIFKSISQSMVSSERSSSPSSTQKKLSPSESDVSTIEKKFSGFIKKEDFTKAKNLIKSKVEKTFKIYEKEIATSSLSQISSEKEEPQLTVKNEENRVDRTDNFKKLLPKSPLVYKSQFVKSQMSFQGSETEKPEIPEIPVNPLLPEKQAEEFVCGNPFEENGSTESLKEREVPEEVEQKVQEEVQDQEEVQYQEEVQQEVQREFQEKIQPTEINPRDSLQWIDQKEDLPLHETFELQQPDFIVMETIQGLPASDLESPSSEKENKNVENSATDAEKYMKKIEAPNPFQINTPSNYDVAPHFPDIEEDKTAKTTPSEGKIKTKKKKFTARFRSFWCSAFGRAKAPTKKGDLS